MFYHGSQETLALKYNILSRKPYRAFQELHPDVYIPSSLREFSIQVQQEMNRQS